MDKLFMYGWASIVRCVNRHFCQFAQISLCSLAKIERVHEGSV